MEAHELPFTLAAGERLEVAARTEPEVFALTDRRLLIGSSYRVAIDLPVSAIRRIQLDVERDRPATIVIVPHEPRHEPQVLAVPHDELEHVSRAVWHIGLRLQEPEHSPSQGPE